MNRNNLCFFLLICLIFSCNHRDYAKPIDVQKLLKTDCQLEKSSIKTKIQSNTILDNPYLMSCIISNNWNKELDLIIEKTRNHRKLRNSNLIYNSIASNNTYSFQRLMSFNQEMVSKETQGIFLFEKLVNSLCLKEYSMKGQNSNSSKGMGSDLLESYFQFDNKELLKKRLEGRPLFVKRIELLCEGTITYLLSLGIDTNVYINSGGKQLSFLENFIDEMISSRINSNINPLNSKSNARFSKHLDLFKLILDSGARLPDHTNPYKMLVSKIIKQGDKDSLELVMKFNSTKLSKEELNELFELCHMTGNKILILTLNEHLSRK